jgi:hypothetical protein
VTFPDNQRIRYIYRTGYDPDIDAESGDATEYPSYDVVEYMENSSTVRRVLASYTYGVPNFAALPLTKTIYKVGDNDDVASGVEGTDKFTTDFAYNSDGTVKYQVQPKVNGLLAGEANAKDYRLGTELTYNSYGQVVYEKRFICDAYTAGSQTFTTGIAADDTEEEAYHQAGNIGPHHSASGGPVNKFTSRSHTMRTKAIWRYCRIGLILVGFHLLISVPFLFLGPMLTIPSHAGTLAWVWWALESPALLVIITTGLASLLAGGQLPLAEYAWFVAIGSLVWFGYGVAARAIIEAVKRLRQTRGSGDQDVR